MNMRFFCFVHENVSKSVSSHKESHETMLQVSKKTCCWHTWLITFLLLQTKLGIKSYTVSWRKTSLYTLQGINISHLGKRKIIFKIEFLWDMLVPWVPWRVYIIYKPHLTVPYLFESKLSGVPHYQVTRLDSTSEAQIYRERESGGYTDVSKNRGTPKWMVKIMENPIKMDDLGGTPIFGNIYICSVT